jgi:hypothetical protein
MESPVASAVDPLDAPVLAVVPTELAVLVADHTARHGSAPPGSGLGSRFRKAHLRHEVERPLAERRRKIER